MRSLVDAALKQAPWSFSAVVFGLDDALDVEGRPLHERRAPSSTKTGVPMELKACPYHDERRGLPMNVSALEQLLRYFPAVAARVAGFRGMLGPRVRSWEVMQLALLDLLAAPALQLLAEKKADAPIGGLAAAGYKLAAGYFDALRRILDAEARGRHLEPSSESFLAFIHEQRLLIGPSEACAGPIEHVTALARLLLDASPPAAKADPLRVGVCRLLSAQLRLGLAWTLADEAAESELVRVALPAALARPRNHVMADRLETRRTALAVERPAEPKHALAALAEVEAQPGLAPLRGVLERWSESAAASDVAVAEVDALLGLGEGGYELTGERRASSRALAGVLVLYRSFVAAQWSLERALREPLGMPLDVGIELSSAILPRGRCLGWVEALTGHHVTCAPAAEPEVVIRSHRRTVRLPA